MKKHWDELSKGPRLKTERASMSADQPRALYGSAFNLITDLSDSNSGSLWIRSAPNRCAVAPTKASANETRKCALISPAAMQSASSECTNSTGHDLMTATSSSARLLSAS